ncbi:hypothetical protein F5Y06DRAFT_259937 [Hypoxylon sp. FL0890]|nr:hypothetical protein F5Y06DRAFT_259937 [Hypoxylon sp. FL0890]
MSTSKTLKSIFDSLKARSNIKEPRDPPPKYEEIALPLPTLDDYQQRAQSLIKQHSEAIPWFPYPDASVVKAYLEAFARGESLGTKNQHYVFAALDEFQRVMQYMDFLVDQAGLQHANGATDCSSWNPEPTKQHWGIHADTELSQLRHKLVTEVVNSWCYITPRPHLPFCYLAACVHETSLGDTHTEDLLYMIDLLDKQFLLLRVRHNCLYAEDLVTSKPGDVDSLVKFRSLIAEARHGKLDFGDLLPERELIKSCFGKSEVFLDDLFGPAVRGGSSAD